MGTLTLYAISTSTSNTTNSVSIFSKSGTQQKKWVLTHVELSYEDIKSDVRIAIDATSSQGYRGDISIDESKRNKAKTK